MAHPQQGSLIGQEQALALIDGIDDPITRRLVRTQVGVAIRLALGGDRPCSDFDMAFYVRCAIDLAHEHQLLRTILDGQEPEGFPE